MKNLMNLVKRIYHDDRGAEGLEKLLIIAAVVLPLLAVLIYFKDWIAEWLSEESDNVREGGFSNEGDPFN